MPAMEPIPDDILFVACTRPAVIPYRFIHVPHTAFYANVGVSFLVGVWFGIWWWLAAIPLHVWMRVECKRDHNFVRVKAAWLQTRLGDLGERFGVTHYLPRSTRPYASVREVNGG